MRRDGNVLFYFINKKKKPWKPCDDLRIKSKILTAIKNLSKKTAAFTISFSCCRASHCIMQHLNSRLMIFLFQKQFAHLIMMYHTGKALLEINLKLSEISWFWDSSQALYAVAYGK